MAAAQGTRRLAHCHQLQRHEGNGEGVGDDPLRRLGRPPCVGGSNPATITGSFRVTCTSDGGGVAPGQGLVPPPWRRRRSARNEALRLSLWGAAAPPWACSCRPLRGRIVVEGSGCGGHPAAHAVSYFADACLMWRCRAPTPLAVRREAASFCRPLRGRNWEDQQKRERADLSAGQCPCHYTDGVCWLHLRCVVTGLDGRARYRCTFPFWKR